MLSSQEVSEANGLVKDLTNLDLKPMASGMYVLTSHAFFLNVFYVWIAFGLILFSNGNYWLPI